MSQVGEWYGHAPSEESPAANDDRRKKWCRFVDLPCNKKYARGAPNGVCSLVVGKEHVPICPRRMYEGNRKVLRTIAEIAFGQGMRLVRPDQVQVPVDAGTKVVAFGAGYVSELKVPTPSGGSYSVDWVLAKLDPTDNLEEFVAVEIQTIDTSDSYRPQVEEMVAGHRPPGPSKAGLNWENVNKRILPQLIYKGHLLRHEPKCTKGLFFVCPTPVYERIIDRLGGDDLPTIHPSPGTLTFHHYQLVAETGELLTLSDPVTKTTTIDAVAYHFVSPTNLPKSGAYEARIQKALAKHLRPSSKRRP